MFPDTRMVPASPLKTDSLPCGFYMSAQRLWLWSHLSRQMSTFKIYFILFVASQHQPGTLSCLTLSNCRFETQLIVQIIHALRCTAKYKVWVCMYVLTLELECHFSLIMNKGSDTCAFVSIVIIMWMCYKWISLGWSLTLLFSSYERTVILKKMLILYLCYQCYFWNDVFILNLKSLLFLLYVCKSSEAT